MNNNNNINNNTNMNNPRMNVNLNMGQQYQMGMAPQPQQGIQRGQFNQMSGQNQPQMNLQQPQIGMQGQQMNMMSQQQQQHQQHQMNMQQQMNTINMAAQQQQTAQQQNTMQNVPPQQINISSQQNTMSIAQNSINIQQHTPPMQNISQQAQPNNLFNYSQQQPQHSINPSTSQNPAQFQHIQGQEVLNQSPQMAIQNGSQQTSMLQGQLQARPNVTQTSQSGMNTLYQQPPSMLCKIACDWLQDFLSKTTEIFQILRTSSAAYLMSNKATQEDRRNRLREIVKFLKIEMNRLKIVYSRIRAISIAENELPSVLDSIIQFEVEKPLPWDSPSKFEEYNSIDKMNTHESRWFMMKPGPQITDDVRADNPKIAALEVQYQELLELNGIRNRQLKEIIHQMRQLIWSTNDMLALRKP